MAIYHLSAKPISRGRGHKIVHKVAYNARTRLKDEAQAVKTKNYKNEGPLLYERIFAPAGAPEWVFNREELWNQVNKIEVRKDARLAREIDVALPFELTDAQRAKLVEGFVKEAFVAHGMLVDVAIHAPTKDGDQRNLHAHIMIPTRGVGPDGLARLKNRDWDKVAMLVYWRELWTKVCNAALEEHGHSDRIDHSSHKARGIARVPTKHVGPEIMRMEKKGIRTRRGDYMRAQKSNPKTIQD